MSNNTTVFFNCDTTANLPFSGAEILVLSLVFLFAVVCFCVTFIDVGIKQMWPAKYLDPAVQARITQIQTQFPNLGQGSAAASSNEEEEATEHTTFVKVVKPKDKTTPVAYNTVVCPSAYIAGKSVDEDLIYVLANNSAFSTVSAYCSSTVRGYTMLSTTLMTAGMCLGYLWVHNSIVDPQAGGPAGKVALLGYVMVFFTSIVMCGPCGHAVYRNANIAMWSNLPITICGKYNPLLHLHELGIGSFVLLPLLAHGYRALSEGETMPNYQGALFGCACQLIGAILFGLANWLGGKVSWFPEVLSGKCAILAEIVCVFASFLAYLQFEFYGTAVCANYLTGFHSLMLAAVGAPLTLFCVKHACFAPSSFATPASLLLLNDGTPVATSGPCTALSYDQVDTIIPNLSAQPSSE
jgi:hypothetical protein